VQKCRVILTIGLVLRDIENSQSTGHEDHRLGNSVLGLQHYERVTEFCNTALNSELYASRVILPGSSLILFQQQICGQTSTSCGASTKVTHKEEDCLVSMSDKIINLTYPSNSIPGLSGLPVHYMPSVWTDLGINGSTLEELGAEWVSFVEAWVKAEIQLGKSGKILLNMATIHDTGLLDAVIAWGLAQLSKQPFDKSTVLPMMTWAMKDWVIKLDVYDGQGCMTHAWCTPGKVRFNLLLLGMKWWIAMDGPSANWKHARDKLMLVFNHINAIQSL
jgi:hypothetical protein